MVYISNAFSLQMQGKNYCSSSKITLDEAIKLVVGLKVGTYIDRESEKDGSDAVAGLTATSCVGHVDIAAVLSGIIGCTVTVNRINVLLKPGDMLIVGQYVGPRLVEGATLLPEGANIDWYKVECTSFDSLKRASNFRKFVHPETLTGCKIQQDEDLRSVVSEEFPEFEFVE